MTDLDTRSSGGATLGDGPPAGPAPGRTVRRARALPRGRAVVGALLVVASAVAVFAAYLDARREPSTSYLVADAVLEPGTRFGDRGEVLQALSSAPIDLMPPLAERAVPVDQVDALVGWTVVAPLDRGDLLLWSALVPDGEAPDAQTLSFSLPRAAAVGGSLRPGEHVDVLATYGSGDRATTTYVVRGVPVLQVTAQDGGALGGGGDLILTVALGTPTDVQAVGHAVNTASVFVARSNAAEQEGGEVPDDYSFGPGAAATVERPAVDEPAGGVAGGAREEGP